MRPKAYSFALGVSRYEKILDEVSLAAILKAMKPEEIKLMMAFKRLIHVLTTGKRTPYEYGGTSLYRAEVHILEIIGESPGVSGSEIVKEMRVTKGAVSQIISKLHKKGLLKKTAGANDMKIQELSLTEKGGDVLFHHGKHEEELIRNAAAILEKCRAEDIEYFARVVSLVTDFIESRNKTKLKSDR